jgi:hypothetical protein
MNSVQLPVQLPCDWRATSVSAGPCLLLAELHACMRAARSAIEIGSCCRQTNLRGSIQASGSRCSLEQVSHAIELIRPTRVLASNASQLSPSPQWPLGFNAGLVEHAADLTRTGQRAGEWPISGLARPLCRRSIFPCSSRTLRSHIATANRLAKSMPVAQTYNSYKDCWSGQTLAHPRGNDRTAGETYEAGEIWKGLPGGPGRMAGRGDDAFLIAISNIPRQYSGALLKILVGASVRKHPCHFVSMCIGADHE